jgi:hypothetical protein
VKPFANNSSGRALLAGRFTCDFRSERDPAFRSGGLGIHRIGDGAVSLRVKLDPVSAPFYMHRLGNESAADEVDLPIAEWCSTSGFDHGAPVELVGHRHQRTPQPEFSFG